MFPWLNALIYKISENMMFNMTRNPDNTMYYGYIDGTGNLTTTLKAPAFVSKGHFLQISDEVTYSVPNIVNINGSQIIPTSDNDDTFLGIEQITGVNV